MLNTQASKNFNWLYPLGFLGLGFSETLFTQWIVYFHSPPDSGLEGHASFIGTILLLSFLLQGIFNPILGYVADRVRHPWGRRRPFIVLGSLPLALIFYGVWIWTDFWISLIMICSFGLLFVFVVQPYVALLPSIASNQKTRIRYSLIGGTLNLLASGAALIGGPFLLETGSFSIFGTLGCFGILLTVFLPSIFLKEARPHRYPQFASHTDFFFQIKSVLKSRPFVWFLLGNGALVMMIISMTIVLPFLCESILLQSRTYTGIINICVFIGVVLAIIYTSLRGSHLSYLSLLRNLGLINGSILFALALLTPLFFLPLYIWGMAFVSLGFMVLVAMMAPHIILAEFTDQDGQHREGAIFGLNGLAICFSNAASSQITSFLLGFGNSLQNPLGVHLVMIFATMAIFLATLSLQKSLQIKTLPQTTLNFSSDTRNAF